MTNTEEKMQESLPNVSAVKKFKEFFSKKPVILAASAIALAISIVWMDNVFMPYTNYFEFGHIFVYMLYIFLYFAITASAATLFSNIGKFEIASYIKTALAIGVFLHMFLAVRDIIAVCDFQYPDKIVLGIHDLWYANLPYSIAAVALAVFVGMFVSRKKKA